MVSWGFAICASGEIEVLLFLKGKKGENDMSKGKIHQSSLGFTITTFVPLRYWKLHFRRVASNFITINPGYYSLLLFSRLLLSSIRLTFGIC